MHSQYIGFETLEHKICTYFLRRNLLTNGNIIELSRWTTQVPLLPTPSLHHV
jgi:hypothetical protein